MDCLPHIHAAAWHDRRDTPAFQQLESFVPGAGVLCDTQWDALRAGGGVIRNSDKRWGVYVVGVWQPLRLGPLRAGLGGGLVTNYKRHPVLPVGGTVFSFRESRHVEHHLFVSPPVKGIAPLTVEYSFTFRWN